MKAFVLAALLASCTHAQQEVENNILGQDPSTYTPTTTGGTTTDENQILGTDPSTYTPTTGDNNLGQDPSTYTPTTTRPGGTSAWIQIDGSAD